MKNKIKTGLKTQDTNEDVYGGDIVELVPPLQSSDPLNRANHIEKAKVVMYVGEILMPHFVDIEDETNKAFITARKVKRIIKNGNTETKKSG